MRVLGGAGRWNSPGTPAVYASSTQALAVLKYLLHIDVEEVPDDVVLLSLEVPDDLPVTSYVAESLMPGWEFLKAARECRILGDKWLKSGSTAVLCVPSALMPEEHNYVLNPRHPAAGAVHVLHVRPFAFDRRLLL